MRILVVTPTYLPIMGGAEKGIHEIFRRLAERHDIRILTPIPSHSLTEEYGIEESLDELPERLEVAHFKDRWNLKNWRGHWKLRGIVPPFSLSAVRAASRAVDEFEPEVVLVFYALPTGLAAVFLERFKKVRCVLSIVGREVPGPGLPPLWGKYVNWIVRRVSQKIFISDFCRRAFSQQAMENSYIIPFGVDVNLFNPEIDGGRIKAHLGIPSEGRVLFALQRLDRWKRVDIILHAFAELRKRMDVYLVVGGKGPEYDRLMDLARTLDIASRVIFTGYIEEDKLPLYYAMSDVFVFHSTYETLGLVLLQALASGRPIVSVDSTAIPEVIENNRSGILVNPMDAEAMAQALSELLENREMAEGLAREARRIALEKYDWDRIVESYEEVLCSCQKK